MGKIIMSEFASLDGVIQDPDGNEGSGAGGWVGHLADRDELYAVKLGEALHSDALLLGRRSYEFFAARWRPRRGALADRLNTLPKYVASSTLHDPGWSNSTVLEGDVVKEVSTLKHEVAGDILVYASFQLMRTLIEHDLVDELRLMVFPAVLGRGKRLFGETSDKILVRLVDTRTVDGDIVYLTYQPVRIPHAQG
ncbi:dihydrofolate reductase [Rhodococcus opacus]|nr:dihydrofolate reductase [Rhodococcus opacus]RZL84436.1 MAG: dihydrofolate reductase [Rhodococcus sp. (in: high G+C Gram-positive bacteria)]